ncbi:hypothetical protein BHYA_0114g00390 [Botrytis hyacinthi]|uniref:Uncharacterized protein n=1 Tax=Botrytis hyacinthi TaxID=278943 RepID=A0A4Z1GKQ0_9HELO|nr:hypothetical protein BHYA_0114g00390 [Botrytis hyacinthi]
MKNISLIASILALAAATSAISTINTNLEVRADPDDLMIFVCNDGLDEICTNMCYGAFCAGIGESLQYDKPDSSTKRNRRKAAGCIASGGNRCSNRKQGGIISAFYKSSYCTGDNGGKCTFTAKFSNSGDIGYCNSEECDADDDNEVIGPGGTANDGNLAEDGTNNDQDAGQKMKKKIKRRNGLGKRLLGAPVYRTSSGLELDIPGGAVIGQRAFVVLPRNATMWDEQAQFGNPNQMREFHGDENEDEDEEDYGYMLANLDIREDTIVEEIVPSV